MFPSKPTKNGTFDWTNVFYMVISYFFAVDQIAHALCGGLSDLIVFLKHVVLNLWKSFFF